MMLPKLPPVSLRGDRGLSIPSPRPFEFAHPSNGDSNCSCDVCDIEHLGTGAIFPECIFTKGGSETVEFYPIATEGDQYSILKESLKIQHL